MDKDITLDQLKKQTQEFCEARNWDQYHGAKDLAIGAVTEASELLEHFRFKTPLQVTELLNSENHRKEIGEELADVLFFLLRFAQLHQFDLADCFQNKMEKNGKKYPVEKFFGCNEKSKWTEEPH